MKLEKMKPGMVVYDCHSYKMGNTNMRSLGIWTVKIISVNLEKRTVNASWNHNGEKTYYQGDYKKWTEKKPTLIKEGLRWRKMTKEEKAAAKAAGTVTPIVH